MKSNYKKLWKYIREVNIRNTDLSVTLLLWISIQKIFIPSIANIIWTDMMTYKIVKKNQFAYWTVTSRNGDKISIALLENNDEAIVSQAYKVFEIIDENELLPEYLIMWFRRPEFDRYARYMSHWSTREVFDWDEMCDLELPVPDITKQQEIVDEYNTIKNRISLNNDFIEKLEETAQSIYREWFVDNVDLENLPDSWKIENLWNIIEISSWKFIEDKNDFIDKAYKYPIYWAWNIMGFSSKILFNEKILSMWRVWTHWVIQRINFPCWTTDNTLVVKTNYYEYIYQILKNLNYDELNRWGVQWLITQTDVKNSKILFPNLDLLNSFEETVWKIMSCFDKKILENENLWKMKDLILSKMVSES